MFTRTWLRSNRHKKKVLGLTPSSGPGLSVIGVGLNSDSKLPTVVNVRVNGCLSLC